MRRPVHFWSEGVRLDGDLVLPDGSGPFPLAVIIHAISGLRWEADFAMADWLAGHGIAAATFDWRGFVADLNDGEVLPQRIVTDLRNAVSYFATVPEVRADSVALVGRGFGSGFAVLAAAADSRVAGAVSLAGFGDFDRRTLLVRGLEDWQLLHKELDDDRLHRVQSGSSARVSVLRVLHALEASGHDAVAETKVGPGLGPPPQISLRSVEAILAMAPEDVVARLAPRPLLVVHPSQDKTFPPFEATSLFAKAREPKRLVFLEAKSHFDFYAGVDDGVWNSMMREVHAWFCEHLGG